jgi:hypothetical protein
VSKSIRRHPVGTALVFALLLTACARPSAPPEPAPRTAGFVDRVWKVQASSSVSPGTLYVFLSDGTLVIASKNGKPALGTWTFENGQLTMVEESLSYPVEVVTLEANEFRLRIHNPGEPVDITFVPAETSTSR